MGSRNVILFGETGVGKSSIVNMIVGGSFAATSDRLSGCTFQHKCYATIIDNVHFDIYDTAGLNEGEQGRVPHWTAIHELYTLIRSLDGVSLLIYCMRGRIKDNTRANWFLFNKVLCAEKVPIIAVETGLENAEDMDARRTELREALHKYGIIPSGVACIVSIMGKKNEHQERYERSQSRLRQLIINCCRSEPWSMTTDDWIGHIYKTTYTTNICLSPVSRVEFSREVGNVVDKLIIETKMKEEDAEKLKATLLHAEKKLRKGKFLIFR